ncbi:MAG: glutamate-5-semialdehyde dehydrogenase [Candidatus Woesearchaeota archaeon]|jgi:glutamate-5-semialdehyde dehydrogenase|nr:glutamate-5-semialdehyde dehydrogenase [Candidatus Woesearchaeota archaeon]
MIDTICSHAKKAAKACVMLDENSKNAILQNLIDQIKENKKEIITENKKDLENAKSKGLSEAFIQRLEMSNKIFTEIIDGIKTIIKLKDPIGQVLANKTLENGLKLKKVRVPLGIILIIYESRPNVTIDVSAICIKSGNVVILKGGSDAMNTNKALFNCIKKAFEKGGINPDNVQFIDSTDRTVIDNLLKRDEDIDVVIPRGGKELIKKVSDSSSIPVIKHYEGVCNIYVDKEADLKKAVDIILNSKVDKPSACNAVENLIIHDAVANELLPKLKKEFDKEKVEMRGCAETQKIIKVKKATEKDYATEYLAKIISIKVVKDLCKAAEFIDTYSSKHTESIITENRKTAELFEKRIDSAVIFHNASTRFTDGGQFGMGCEIGISTQKLHARGPMGLKEMTSYKFIVEGDGQVRN